MRKLPPGTERAMPDGTVRVKQPAGGWRARKDLVAEAELSRALQPNEQVVHATHDKSDDSPSNLLVRQTVPLDAARPPEQITRRARARRAPDRRHRGKAIQFRVSHTDHEELSRRAVAMGERSLSRLASRLLWAHIWPERAEVDR